MMSTPKLKKYDVRHKEYMTDPGLNAFLCTDVNKLRRPLVSPCGTLSLFTGVTTWECEAGLTPRLWVHLHMLKQAEEERLIANELQRTCLHPTLLPVLHNKAISFNGEKLQRPGQTLKGHQQWRGPNQQAKGLMGRRNRKPHAKRSCEAGGEGGGKCGP